MGQAKRRGTKEERAAESIQLFLAEVERKKAALIAARDKKWNSMTEEEQNQYVVDQKKRAESNKTMSAILAASLNSVVSGSHRF